MDLPADLPGQDLVSAGLSDLDAGRVSVEALLVEMAAPRLRALGLEVNAPERSGVEASHRLFELLSVEDGAHAQYNALVARIVSFADAAEHAAAR